MTQAPPLKATRQRAAILAALAEAQDFLSAQDLHQLLRNKGDGVGLSTVYRTLQALTDTAQVDCLISDDGEARYRRCSSGHHHHLVCRGCGRAIEVENPRVESWARQVADQHGFTHVSHRLEVFGTCAACAGSVGQEEP